MKPSPVIFVSREVISGEMTLQDVSRMVSDAVWKQYREFGAVYEGDVYPEEIYNDFVIVYNCSTMKYYKANYSLSKSGDVKFKNIVEVKRQWKTVKTVQRSEDKLLHIYWEAPTTWGSVLR